MQYNELKSIKHMLFSGNETEFNIAKNSLIQNKDKFTIDDFWNDINYCTFGNELNLSDLYENIIYNNTKGYLYYEVYSDGNNEPIHVKSTTEIVYFDD